MDQLSTTTAKTEIITSRFIRENEWNPEDVLKAIVMFNAHYSMGAIGNEVGRTRNAVAGLINRLRRKGDKTIEPVRSKPRQPKGRVTAMIQPKSRGVFVSRLLSKEKSPEQKTRIRLKLIEDDTSVTFQELDHHHCRWPIGDPRRSDFRFCGCPRVSLSHRTPYCAKHATIAGNRYQNGD